MTKHSSKVAFDNEAEIKVQGKIDGRDVEYTGYISNMYVEVDDGIDDETASMYSWKFSSYNPEVFTYSFTFETVDGKAITAKIGKKKVSRTAAVFYKQGITDIDSARLSAGAPKGAGWEKKDDSIVFDWTEEV